MAHTRQSPRQNDEGARDLSFLMPPTPDDEARLHFYEHFDQQRPGRAAFWALQKACGRPVSEIAKRAGLNPVHVQRELRWAERQGHFDKAQDRLYKLLDKAVDVYEQALDDKTTVRGDKDVARDLLNGAGVLGKHLTVSPGGGDGADRETFEVWRARFSRPAHPIGDKGSPPPALPATPDDDPSEEGGAEALGEGGDLPVVDGVAIGVDDTPDVGPSTPTSGTDPYTP